MRIFLGKGPSQGHISGLLDHGSKIPVDILSLAYIQNFISLGAEMTKTSVTDGRADDSIKSIVHIFQKCALKN
jgi:hypothetical protein